MGFRSKTKQQYVLSAFDKFERKLMRYASRMLHGDSEKAADAVQFAFMKLCEQESVKPDSQLQSWLYTVCRNRIIDDVRRNGRFKAAEADLATSKREHHIDPEKFAADQDDLRLLRNQIDQMSDQDRELIDLWSHGLKHNEIADVVSRKPGTVRVQLHRAIKTLRQNVGEAEPGKSRLIK